MKVFVAGPVAWNLLVFLRDLPRPEPHMTFAERHAWTLGGTSAGKALNLARLGADVTLRTVVGSDENGRHVVDLLRAEGVRVMAEVDPDGATEQHLNLMSSTGQRVSLYLAMPAADRAILTPQVRDAMVAADVVVIDLAESARPLLRVAKELGRQVWVDLHDDDGVDEFRTPFRVGAQVLFGASDRLTDPDAWARAHIKAGRELVVCTHGAGGATAWDAAGRVYSVAAEPVSTVRDSNGAGDAFFSAFLVAHHAGLFLSQAMSHAARWAAACVRSDEMAPPRGTELL